MAQSNYCTKCGLHHDLRCPCGDYDPIAKAAKLPLYRSPEALQSENDDLRAKLADHAAKVAEMEAKLEQAQALYSASLKEIVPKDNEGPRYPKPDEAGNDTGPCCAHAYADGWYDCRMKVIKAVAMASEKKG